MEKKREYLISVFTALGRRLENFGKDESSADAIELAEKENGWFMQSDILPSVEAIRTRMLDESALVRWLALYPIAREQKSVGVIMAGNIPLVGFFDLLCVVISGHKCYYKPSSKDKVLIEYVVSLLKEIAPELPLEQYANQHIDAVIATGSDNTNRYFKSRYGDIPAIFRGSRASVAVLDGSESGDILAALATDVFSYSGLGCRNVSHLLVPAGYDIGMLTQAFADYGPVNPKYTNNYRQRKAVLSMQGQPFADGGFFILREEAGFPEDISEITYQRYSDRGHAMRWLRENDTAIQCVVGNTDFPRGAGFGQSQSPALTDYPDAVDTIRFLSSL